MRGRDGRLYVLVEVRQVVSFISFRPYIARFMTLPLSARHGSHAIANRRDILSEISDFRSVDSFRGFHACGATYLVRIVTPRATPRACGAAV